MRIPICNRLIESIYDVKLKMKAYADFCNIHSLRGGSVYTVKLFLRLYAAQKLLLIMNYTGIHSNEVKLR